MNGTLLVYGTLHGPLLYSPLTSTFSSTTETSPTAPTRSSTRLVKVRGCLIERLLECRLRSSRLYHPHYFDHDRIFWYRIANYLAPSYLIGTFSSVYVAKDLDHYKYKNSWCHRHIPDENNSRRNSTCGKVALKRIYATSSSTRIGTEIDLLIKLRYNTFRYSYIPLLIIFLSNRISKHNFVTSLVTAIRHEDQIIAV